MKRKVTVADLQRAVQDAVRAKIEEVGGDASAYVVRAFNAEQLVYIIVDHEFHPALVEYEPGKIGLAVFEDGIQAVRRATEEMGSAVAIEYRIAMQMSRETSTILYVYFRDGSNGAMMGETIAPIPRDIVEDEPDLPF